MSFGIKLKKGPSKNTASALKSMRNAINTAFFIIAGRHGDERKNIYGNFSNASSRPDFVPIIEFGKFALLKMELNAVSAEQATLSVWQLLDRGTKVRYMGLSEDWASKTAPNSLSVGAGDGYVTGIGKRALLGIESRNFDENVNVLLESYVEDVLQQFIEVGFEEIFR